MNNELSFDDNLELLNTFREGLIDPWVELVNEMHRYSGTPVIDKTDLTLTLPEEQVEYYTLKTPLMTIKYTTHNPSMETPYIVASVRVFGVSTVYQLNEMVSQLGMFNPYINTSKITGLLKDIAKKSIEHSELCNALSPWIELKKRGEIVAKEEEESWNRKVQYRKSEKH